MSDPIEPDDPDVRFHAAWLAQLHSFHASAGDLALS